jgi:hypothetical protein
MAPTLESLVLVLAIALIAGAGGVAFGIFVLAPRIARLLDRTEDDEEPGDRTD